MIGEILRGNTLNRFMENIDGISPKVLTERLENSSEWESSGEELCQSILSEWNII